jgi:hypothetical protein
LFSRRDATVSDTLPNNRRQRTPRVRPACIQQRWRGAAAVDRYALTG